MFIDALAYLGVLLGFLFLALCLASGLYYIAEFIEENTVLFKRILTYLINIVMGIHLLLVFDLKLLQLLFSLVCVIVYSLMLTDFPQVQIQSPVFLISAGCFLLIQFWLLPTTMSGQCIFLPIATLPALLRRGLGCVFGPSLLRFSYPLVPAMPSFHMVAHSNLDDRPKKQSWFRYYSNMLRGKLGTHKDS
jgi:hypothetical protein